MSFLIAQTRSQKNVRSRGTTPIVSYERRASSLTIPPERFLLFQIFPVAPSGQQCFRSAKDYQNIGFLSRELIQLKTPRGGFEKVPIRAQRERIPPSGGINFGSI
eukprot:TRINITY_DN2315_c0_g1_i13.p1 TRINITY_DN2315_c0_g1~~TRINITY_DN2315_c0_g1_i13.p1  ORF type:complete len:105 (+),score=9.26 TRINITY_DN2315_c0_g1_i13:214-528(+)